VDLFPIVTVRRKISRLGEDQGEEATSEDVVIRTSEEGREGGRTKEENAALRRREVFIRHHTQSGMNVSQILDLNPMISEVSVAIWRRADTVESSELCVHHAMPMLYDVEKSPNQM